MNFEDTEAQKNLKKDHDRAKDEQARKDKQSKDYDEAVARHKSLYDHIKHFFTNSEPGMEPRRSGTGPFGHGW